MIIYINYDPGTDATRDKYGDKYVNNTIVAAKYCKAAKEFNTGKCEGTYTPAVNDPSWCCVGNNCACRQYCPPVTCVPKNGEAAYGLESGCPDGYNESYDDPENQCCIGAQCRCKKPNGCLELNTACSPIFSEEEEESYPCCKPCTPCPTAESEEQETELPCECLCLPTGSTHRRALPGRSNPMTMDIVGKSMQEQEAIAYDPYIQDMSKMTRYRNNPFHHNNRLDVYPIANKADTNYMLSN